MLKKKHNAIAYHRVRESIAAGIIRFFHIPSTKNLADILTKPLNTHLFHQIAMAILFAQTNIPVPVPSANSTCVEETHPGSFLACITVTVSALHHAL
jgi:hypothetical protein